MVHTAWVHSVGAQRGCTARVHAYPSEFMSAARTEVAKSAPPGSTSCMVNPWLPLLRCHAMRSSAAEDVSCAKARVGTRR